MNAQNDDRLSSLMLWNGAEEYLKAANILFESHKSTPSFARFVGQPAYFLVCQSIELALKAYLRGSGKDEDFLVNKCRHDIVITLDAAEKCGLTNLVKFEPPERAVLNLANQHYSSKALQFTIVGAYTYPDFEVLLMLAEKLITKIEAFCIEKVNCHEGKDTAVVGLRSARRK